MHTIQDLRSEFEEYLGQNGFDLSPKELYEPLDYILALGGKRMRPILVMMACNLFSEELKPSLAPAYGVELFHNFSLMHDDIMDEAPLRRGKATVHTKYNTNTAILSGDVMLVYAYQYVAQVASELLPIVIKVFNETAIGVCEGQQMDMNFETSSTVSIPEYIRMIELKTSVLVHGGMKIGALVGGATETQADLVAEFGRNMGIAFQLQDDLLDTFGESAKVGKRIGGDILQNKKTYLVLKALELVDATTRQELMTWMTTSTNSTKEEEKIEAVRAIFTASGVVEAINKEIQNYENKALEYLAQVDLPAKQKEPLKAFLSMIMQREH
ncbi:MAG: polyprenyl synthetase family protein [Aureispira sp.]|nr:polyprenyl synthetase family protein [Aureispira sp.]